ncbi:MAG: imidazole glycerol phosphate synthase subunit HisH [Rickettsiales bacterium]|nr:imidazole glycerol phosphate synthase subunit HisH [Rickettsiales bacterium]
MKTVIIDYGAGNVESVVNALRMVGGDEEIVISNKISDLKSAHHLILPGVGAFGDCMAGLGAIEGLASEIRKQALVEKKPFLGICVGMQVLASIGYENGEHPGLGFINGKVEKIVAKDGLKIPHMGWNEIILKAEHPVLKDIKSGEHFYFANSYHFICQNEHNVLAQVEYGSKLNVAIAKDNIFGAQFHPEKSGEAGLKLLKNFLNWRP